MLLLLSQARISGKLQSRHQSSKRYPSLTLLKITSNSPENLPSSIFAVSGSKRTSSLQNHHNSHPSERSLRGPLPRREGERWRSKECNTHTHLFPPLPLSPPTISLPTKSTLQDYLSSLRNSGPSQREDHSLRNERLSSLAFSLSRAEKYRPWIKRK